MSAEPLIDRQFIRLDHGLIHMRTAGSAARPPLVMLHASPSSSRSLLDLMGKLARTFFVIAPDTPGNGQSDPLDSPAPDLADYAAAFEAMRTQMNLGPVPVYGTHTGAHIAIEWAQLAENGVAQLVLDGVALLDAPTRADFLEHYAPPMLPEPDGRQFHWAWSFIRDQMIFFPHYKKDLDHLRPGGTFDPQLLHDLTLDVLNALETYHLPYQAVFAQDVLARAKTVKRLALVLTAQSGPLEHGLDTLIEAMPNAQSAASDGSTEQKSNEISDFLLAAQ